PVFERGGVTETHAASEATKATVAASAAPHAEVAGLEYLLMLVTLGIVGVGFLLARRFYQRRPEIPKRLAQRYPALADLLANKFYVEQLYPPGVVRAVMAVCRFLHAFDVRIVDGTVNGVRHLTVLLSHLSRFFDQYVVDGLVN